MSRSSWTRVVLVLAALLLTGLLIAYWSHERQLRRRNLDTLLSVAGVIQILEAYECRWRVLPPKVLRMHEDRCYLDPEAFLELTREYWMGPERERIVDAWGNLLVIEVCDVSLEEYDNALALGHLEMKHHWFGIYSRGANGIDELGSGDDIARFLSFATGVVNKRPQVDKFVVRRLKKLPNSGEAGELLKGIAHEGIAKYPEVLPYVAHYLKDETTVAGVEIGSHGRQVLRVCDIACYILQLLTKEDFGAERYWVPKSALERARKWVHDNLVPAQRPGAEAEKAQ